MRALRIGSAPGGPAASARESSIRLKAIPAADAALQDKQMQDGAHQGRRQVDRDPAARPPVAAGQLNVAVQVRAAVIVTTVLTLVPRQSPDQITKLLPPVGCALRPTMAPVTKVIVHGALA
jgi:hypothetical protein